MAEGRRKTEKRKDKMVIILYIISQLPALNAKQNPEHSTSAIK